MPARRASHSESTSATSEAVASTVADPVSCVSHQTRANCTTRLPSREKAWPVQMAKNVAAERQIAYGFAAEMAIGFPVLWDRGGDTLASALAIQRLPTTLIVDRSGIIRKVHLGYDAKEGERLEQEVRALLAEPAPDVTAGAGSR